MQKSLMMNKYKIKKDGANLLRPIFLLTLVVVYGIILPVIGSYGT